MKREDYFYRCTVIMILFITLSLIGYITSPSMAQWDIYGGAVFSGQWIGGGEYIPASAERIYNYESGTRIAYDGYGAGERIYPDSGQRIGYKSGERIVPTTVYLPGIPGSDMSNYWAYKEPFRVLQLGSGFGKMVFVTAGDWIFSAIEPPSMPKMDTNWWRSMMQTNQIPQQILFTSLPSSRMPYSWNFY